MPRCNADPTACPAPPSPRVVPLQRPGLRPGRPQWLGARGWRGVVLLVAALLAACAGTGPGPLPPMTPSDPSLVAGRCAAIFPQGRWQMLHAIEFHLADGTSGNALGVLLLDGRGLSCALMTVEGLTLFEAHSAEDGSLEVLRALPPFTGGAFAAGLIADVRALFRTPAGAASFGSLPDGSPVCRYVADRTMTDVLPGTDGCFRLHTYAPTPPSGVGSPVRTRTVEARACGPAGGILLPQALTLTGHGPAGYTMNLRLLGAEPLPDSTP